MTDIVRFVEADDLESTEIPDSEDPDWAAAEDHRIADRLDALEAEKVMARALELEADANDVHNSLTPAQLERVAEEVGVAPEFVQQALGELRLAPRPRTRFARWVIPDDLFETATIEGVSRTELDTSVEKWMTQNEGFAKGALLDDGVEWDVDRRWRSRVLARSLSGANRMAKITGGDVAHRVHSASEHHHHVALSSEGFRPLLLARVVMSIGLIVSALGLLGAAVADDLAFGIPAFAGMALASIWVAVAGARWWARGIRGALRRSLTAMMAAAEPGGRRWLPRWPKRKR